MKQIIYTLVRIAFGKDCGVDTYVSRSFSKLDGEAAKTIRTCIEEDMYNEDAYETKEEFNSKYVFDLETIASLAVETDEEFDHNGILIWQDRNDEDDLFQYIIHPSIMEIPDHDGRTILEVKNIKGSICSVEAFFNDSHDKEMAIAALQSYMMQDKEFAVAMDKYCILRIANRKMMEKANELSIRSAEIKTKN